MYGTTEKKMTHAIQEHSDNGLCGYWARKCGKYIRPVSLHDNVPEGARICKQCAKKEADHEVS